MLFPFIYIDSLFDRVNLPRQAYVALITSLWFLSWLINLKNKKITLYWNPLFLLVLFLLFLASISILWGWNNMLYEAELYFYISIVMLCFMALQVDINTVVKFSSAIAIIGALIALIGVLQNFGLNLFDYKQIAPPASTFINKNFASNYIELVLPVTITLFFVSKNKNEAWLFAVYVSIIVSYIMLTKTRGAYLSTFITLSAFLICIQLLPLIKKQITHISALYKKQILLIILVPIILSVSPYNSHSSKFDESRYMSIFAGNSQNSISSRFNAYNNSMDIIKDNIVLGVGLGGFQQNFRPYLQSRLAKNKIFSDFIYLHNDPLQLVVELGIIGAITALLFFIFLFRFSYLSLKSKSDVNYDPANIHSKLLYVGFSIAVIASLSHSLFSFPYHQVAPATIMAIWVGFLLNLSAKKFTITDSIKLRVARVFLILVSLIFLFATSYFYYKYIQSSYYMKQSKTSTDCARASDLAIRSINTYAKDYLSQSQGIHMIASCPLETRTQLLFAEKILKANPTHPTALYLAAISYFKLGDYESSYNTLKLLSFLYPYFSSAHILNGHIAVKKKDYPRAKSYYQHTLRLSPGNPEAINMLQQLSEKGY